MAAQKRQGPEEAHHRFDRADIVGDQNSADDNKVPSPFQSFGDITAGIVAKIAARHRLSEPHAAIVIELAGIGRAVGS